MSTIDKPTEKPTTVRLPKDLVDRLEAIRKVSTLTRNALIGLAIDSFADVVERTGKIPIPALKRRTKRKEAANG